MESKNTEEMVQELAKQAFEKLKEEKARLKMEITLSKGEQNNIVRAEGDKMALTLMIVSLLKSNNDLRDLFERAITVIQASEE
ncbi:hypothetical protein [Capnocytophaga haemolytica]